jgi:arylsulfatase
LKENGYATSWFGKDHNTPGYQSSQAGPFNQWPNGMGFEYFYGFTVGDTSQWQPNLFQNTTAIYPFLDLATVPTLCPTQSLTFSCPRETNSG